MKWEEPIGHQEVPADLPAFEACTQTLSRPGAMLGHGEVGIQGEHYNHTNCTYAGGEPGTWRGAAWSHGIGWTHAGALCGGLKLAELAPAEFPLPLLSI